jgi:hypothetical protein
VLDAKGGENKAKEKMDQLPLVNFENSRVRVLFVKILSFASYCQKLVSCGEKA